MSEPLKPIDLKRLAAEVSVQHGIRIDPDDPMFAVVTLNRLIFDQAIAEVLERMQFSIRDFEAATEKVQIRVGVALAREVRECGVALQQEAVHAFEQANQSSAESQIRKRVNCPPSCNSVPGAIAVGVVLFAIGVLVGAAVH